MSEILALLIEDYEPHRKIIHRLVERGAVPLGRIIDEAESYESGLSLIRSRAHESNVLFVDDQMPRNSLEQTKLDFGSLLVAAYREVCPHGLVVIISSQNFGGGDRFIPKGLNTNEMVERMSSLIQG